MSIITVTVPAASRALALLASVKTELGIAVSTFDTELGERIAQISGAIDRYCGRVFARETVQEVFRSERASCSIRLCELMLARHPVAAITSVVVDGTTLDAAEYEVDGPTGFLWRLSSDRRVDWCGSKITVLYAAGYLLPGDGSANLPADITLACITAVKAWHAAKGRDPMLRSETQEGVGATSYLDARGGVAALPAQVIDLLAPYRALRL